MRNLLIIIVSVLAGIPVICCASNTYAKNWTWEYGVQPGSTESTAFNLKFRMKFDGTTEIDGKTWHCFKTVQSSCESILNPTDVMSLENGSTFLINVENGKWMVRLPLGENPMILPDFDWNYTAYEAPLYNFNCTSGDYMQFLDWNGEVRSARILSKSEITVDGENLSILNLSIDEGLKVCVIEDIGPIEFGVLPYLQTAVKSGGIGQIPSKLPVSNNNQSLIAVYDEDGNVVFDATHFTTGLDDVLMDSETTVLPSATFDIMGNMVIAPRSGSVYIRNGKKFVCPAY